MPSSADNALADKGYRQDPSQESWRSFLLSIVRIVLLEVVLLLALSGALVIYLNWSSEVTFAEFLAASAVLAPSTPSLPSVEGHRPCDKGA
jgi:hypothetical protein